MKKTFMAILAMATAITMAQAQVNITVDRDTNHLFATTGPNTVGAGHLQLGFTAGYLWQRSASDLTASPTTRYSSSTLGGTATLRYGLGEHIELSANFGMSSISAHYASTINIATPTIDTTGTTYNLGVGFRIKMLQSHTWWMPTVTLGLGGFMPIVLGTDSASVTHIFGTAMQMRNHIGKRWAIDYSIGFSLGDGQHPHYIAWHYGVTARYLATESLMLGVGLNDGSTQLEASWQATPTLQLNIKGGVSGGLGILSGVGSIKGSATLGVSWMLK